MAKFLTHQYFLTRLKNIFNIKRVRFLLCLTNCQDNPPPPLPLTYLNCTPLRQFQKVFIENMILILFILRIQHFQQDNSVCQNCEIYIKNQSYIIHTIYPSNCFKGTILVYVILPELIGQRPVWRTNRRNKVAMSYSSQ